MTAWSSANYHAIGIYLGGVNSACSQPNLTPDWVSTEVTAGWHLIPTYVGLQAPNGSCSSCGAINPKKAAAQGAAAAADDGRFGAALALALPCDCRAALADTGRWPGVVRGTVRCDADGAEWEGRVAVSWRTTV